jgi:hypothetical protein
VGVRFGGFGANSLGLVPKKKLLPGFGASFVLSEDVKGFDMVELLLP